MAIFSKNEIIVPLSDFTVGEMNFKTSHRFLVTSAGVAKTSATRLNDDNSLSEDCIQGKTAIFQKGFKTTGLKLTSKKVLNANAPKKDDFYIFNTEYKDEEVLLPKGSLVRFLKGGANPTFYCLVKQKNGYETELAVSQRFIDIYMEPSQPVECNLTKDWSIKNFKPTMGQDSLRFDMSICYQGKKIGTADNDGYGGSHRIDVTGEAWSNLNKAVYEIIRKEVNNSDKEAEHKIRFNETEDYIVEYYTGFNQGLISLENYVIGRVNSLKKYIPNIATE